MLIPLGVCDFINRAEEVYGDRIGVIDEPDQPATPMPDLTYAQLAELGRRQAAYLDSLGIGHGERVAVVSHNSTRLLSCFFGVSGYGRILVPINFRLKADEVSYIVQQSGARVLYVDPELDHDLRSVRVEHRFVLGEDAQLYAPAGQIPRPWNADENATATINYTSGTTAQPKGVELTHRNLWLNAVTMALHAGVTDRDVYLHTLPQFHVNGWGMPFAMTALGVPQVMLRKIDGAEILRRVADSGVTLMCAAPTVANSILAALDTWTGEVPGRGRVRIIVAGAPPPTRTLIRIEQELGWEFMQIYGMTETSPLLTFNRSRSEWDGLPVAERAEKLLRAGAPALGVRLRIDSPVEVHGEVLARSNVVSKGYWDNPKETARSLTMDGWLRTGDGGFLDEGYLSIKDRKKDVIITGGENVSSIEIEDVLFSHPAVTEVAVIGVPDEKWGETIKALVVLAEGHRETTEAELIGWCKRHVAGFKAPTSIEFRDELTRTSTGKLQKFKLREEFWPR